MKLFSSCEKATFLVEFRYPIGVLPNLNFEGKDISDLSAFTRVQAHNEDTQVSKDFAKLHKFIESIEMNDGIIANIFKKKSVIYITASFENCNDLVAFIEVIRKELLVKIMNLLVEYTNPLNYSKFKITYPLFYAKVFQRELDNSEKASRRRLYWLQRSVDFFNFADKFKCRVSSQKDGKVYISFKNLKDVVKFNAAYYEGITID